MQSFLEYISTQPRRRSDLTREELQLLLKARNRLQETEFKEGMVDNTGSLSDPHIWIPLPKDLNGGLRIYTIFGSLAVRLQKSPSSHPVGPAYKVVGRKTKEEEERKKGKSQSERTEDFTLKPDFSAIDRLYGEITSLIKKMRAHNKKSKHGLISGPGATIQFKGFWPNTPTGKPLY